MGRDDEIRLIAYNIWEEEGYVHGHDYEHWLKAEVIWEDKQKTEPVSKDVKAESERVPKQTKKNKRSRKRR